MAAVSYTYDLILRGGEVIDGSGAGRFGADVAVKGDRIAHIGRLDRADAERVVNVTGRIICPGFIDVHTHDDRVCIDRPAMHPKISQGVTTVVIGNCGLSLAPLICRFQPGRTVEPARKRDRV